MYKGETVIRKASIFFAILVLVPVLQGCTPYWTVSGTPPTGLWFCEELSMTLDFEDGVHSAKGEMLEDGVRREVLCIIEVSGSGVNMYYTDEITDEDFNIYEKREEMCFLRGYLEKKGKDKMILSEMPETGVEYTFTKISE